MTGLFKSWIPLVEERKRLLPQISDFLPEYIYEVFEAPFDFERHCVPWHYILRWWNHQRDSGTEIFMTIMKRERRRLQLESRLAQDREAVETEDVRDVNDTA